MPCFHPLRAYRDVGGGVVFHSNGSGAPAALMLPCGQCVGCRYERSRTWALRCVHEAQMHDSNCFITLTYDELPKDGSLCVADWQKFAKRLRHKVGSFRFYACGEYGERNLRPHFHACMFGVDWPDKVLHGYTDRGDPLFTSSILERSWGHGLVSSGEMTYESAAYVARYCMKKAGGALADKRYSRIDAATGEVFYVKPEFAIMSRNPGVGATWFDKFMDDAFPSDAIVHDGRKFQPPRYYENRLLSLSAMCSGAVSDIADASWRLQRRRSSMEHSEDLTPERLAVRESVIESRLAVLSREDL